MYRQRCSASAERSRASAERSRSRSSNASDPTCHTSDEHPSHASAHVRKTCAQNRAGVATLPKHRESQQLHCANHPPSPSAFASPTQTAPSLGRAPSCSRPCPCWLRRRPARRAPKPGGQDFWSRLPHTESTTKKGRNPHALPAHLPLTKSCGLPRARGKKRTSGTTFGRYRSPFNNTTKQSP